MVDGRILYHCKKGRVKVFLPPLGCSSASWLVSLACPSTAAICMQNSSFVNAYQRTAFICYCMLVPDKRRTSTNIHVSLDSCVIGYLYLQLVVSLCVRAYVTEAACARSRMYFDL